MDLVTVWAAEGKYGNGSEADRSRSIKMAR
jgi:hypothetical protein